MQKRFSLLARSFALIFCFVCISRTCHFSRSERQFEQTSYQFQNSSNLEVMLAAENGDTYKAYIANQQSKLNDALNRKRVKKRKTHGQDHVFNIDIGRSFQVHDEFNKYAQQNVAGISSYNGISVIALGARLGGEVRAFKSLGALAVGIDLNPGPNNVDVLSGDFHNLAFNDESFDVAYCNVIDHVFSIDKFSKEVCRVLRQSGTFFASLYDGVSDQFEGPGSFSRKNESLFVAKMTSAGFHLVYREDFQHDLKLSSIKTWKQTILTLGLQRTGKPC